MPMKLVSMKKIIALVSLCITWINPPLYSESPDEYKTRLAYEALSEVDQRQINAIRECGVSRVRRCLRGLITNLEKEKDYEMLIRRESVISLGNMRMTEALAPLRVLYAKEKDISVKSMIVRALGQIAHKDDLKFVTSLLGDPEVQIRKQAARALFIWSDKSTIAEIQAKIGTEKEDVVKVELLATAYSHDQTKLEYIDQLVKLLQSKDRLTRARAGEVLGELKVKEALVDLEHAAEAENDAYVRPIIRRAYLETLYFQ